MGTQTVANFYDQSQRWFTWFYSDQTSLALHYGFWDTDTRSREDALMNQYHVVMSALNPQPGQWILDAGCGVGGASIWMAQHSQANFDGVTISTVQAKLAQKYVQAHGVQDRVHISQQNYFEPTFPDQTLDGVFAIESFCHSYPDPKRVFQAMYRILKPGGRLVMSDGFLRRKPTNDYEQSLADSFAHGYSMDGWNTAEEITQALESSGFRMVKMIDKTAAIEPSVMDIERRGKRAVPFLRMLNWFGRAGELATQGLLATSTQREFYEAGLFGYGIFVAEKPTK